MSWIDEELDREHDVQHASQPAPSDEQVLEAARAWWQWFGQALKRNADDARQRGIPADFSEPARERYRVSNSEAGLAANFALDEQIRSVRFDYSSSKANMAAPEAAPTSAPAISNAPPEGGVITLRPRGSNRVAPFLSDQHLYEHELMRTLLKPVLFPNLPS
ncbi:MAG TPA: hypothetical protein VE998_05055 [Terriglobales bacterium]|nr:hypothetical protein [Terriglobales bacterium]